MQQGHCKSVFAPRAIVLAVAGCFSAGLSLANPVGPSVVSGSATFATQGNVLTVTNSAGAVINWQGFSIGASEVTRFIQPSAASSVLNRVVTADPSILLGTLQSNGRVFLINPAGILVGAGAVVDTAGFVASTLNLSNSDFAAGKLNFTATPGAGIVRNDGTITTPSGGSVYLVGAQVENHGIINTPNGETLLAAGQTVQLVDTATPGVRVEITADKEQALNLGQLLAESGRIGVVGAVVRNNGRISASSVTQAGGRIFLKATQDVTVAGSGSVEATGVTGGQADILGNAIVLTDSARVDVSGTQGGGTIRVGGDTQGKGADVQNALTTTVGGDVVLKADALTQGKGGKVVVWSDETTHMNGSISARGGSESGDGGFVETSGGTIDFYGARVDASATRGQAGSWLIDPDSLSINTAGASALVTALDNGTSGTNVHLYNNTSAYGSVTGDGLGGISVCSPVTWTKASELWLDATTSISINASISNSNTASRLRLDAGAGGISQSSSTISVANLLVKSGGLVNLSSLSVDTLAGNVNGSLGSFVNTKALRIGSYMPTDSATEISGMTTVGALSIDTGMNGLTLDRPLVSGTAVSLKAGQLTNNSTVRSLSGFVSIAADKLDLNAPADGSSSVDAGSGGVVTIIPRTTSQTVELGGASKNTGDANVLSLTEAEMRRIRADYLMIGNYCDTCSVPALNSWNISVIGDLDLTRSSDSSLVGSGLSRRLGLYAGPLGAISIGSGVAKLAALDEVRFLGASVSNTAADIEAPGYGSESPSISVIADTINFGSGRIKTGNDGSFDLSPITNSRNIQVGGSKVSTALSVTEAELQQLASDNTYLSIGRADWSGQLVQGGALDLTGTLASMALISGGSLNVAYPITTPHAILLGARGGNVSQTSTAKITASHLMALASTGIALDNTVNQVRNVTLQTTTGSVAFRNQSYDATNTLSVMPVSTLCSNYDVDCYTSTDSISGVVTKYLSIGKSGYPVASFTDGIRTGSGVISLSNVGSIVLAAPVATDASSTDSVVSIEAIGSGAAITRTGSSASVVGYALQASAVGGIGSAATPLWTQVSTLRANGGAGNLYVANTGALTTYGVSASGEIFVAAKSPLTIASGDGVTSTGNNAITLVAGASGSTATTDVLTIDGPVTTSGAIKLRAGNGITGLQVPGGSNVVATANINSMTTATLSQCQADGGLPGCSAVLAAATPSVADPSVTTTVQTTQTQTVTTLTTTESKTGSSSTSSVIAAASYTAPVQTTTTTTATTAQPTQTLAGGVVGGETANSFGSSSSDSGSGGSGTTTVASSGSSSGSSGGDGSGSGPGASSGSGQSSSGGASSGDRKNDKGKTGYGQCVLR
ncbi:filamentous hemagglutinin N-terminal domain-containing protein [uncultured Propionivibrio sp.]|uniref:two-partner secretion domain-containing protein n=1 Tax=uncultured Propionivibrio sp. TaxID=426737 RepID=UPI0029C0E0E0|nr:filamentous hemagglutinin N-terminal domain-containing protein [uncultured Propionivibrio sp.]